MKRSILTGLSLVLVAACQDGTSPQSDAPLGQATDARADVGTNAVSHLLAVVDLNGGLLRGSNVISSTKLGPGQYEVTFNTNVSQCAYVATTSNAYSQAIQVFTAGGHLSPNGVYVETKNQGGGLTDGPFQLVTTCGTGGIRYAVVGYADDLVRATAGTSLTPLGGGRFNIRFAQAVNTCVFIATVADPGNALVFFPNNVSTGSGPNANTVYIETKNSGGGLSSGIPFHLALVCPGIAKTRFAVVRGDGTIQRGSPGTIGSRLSTGNFNIHTTRSLAACATVATRGSGGTGVPFTPATVEITAGADANSYGAQVRSLLFFGGNLINQAIHTASVCI